MLVPTIAFVAPDDRGPLDEALDRLARGEYGVCVLTSENGVRALFDAMHARGLDARAFGRAKIAVVGPGTKAALASHGVRADVMAKEFRGEGLAAAILEAVGVARPRVLVARAREAREILPDTLRSKGLTVDVVPVYVTVPVAGVGDRVRSLLSGEGGGLDAVLLTSASTADRFADALGGESLPPGVLVASIGPVTSEAIKKRGLPVHVEAPEATVAALIDALEAAQVDER